MSIPSVNLTVVDGGLGSVAASTDRLAVVIGPASSGGTNAPTLVSSVDALVSAFGYGPGPSLAAACMQASGQPVLMCRSTTSVAGSAGAVTHSGTGTATMTITGTPYDKALLLVTVASLTGSGTVGTDAVTVAVSLDNGTSTIGAFAVNPGTGEVAIPTLGIVLEFSLGDDCVVGDTYEATIDAPASDPAAVVSAIEAVGALPSPVPSLFFDAGERTAGDCTTLSLAMAALASDYLYARLFTSSDTTATPAALAVDFATFTSVRVGVGAGQARGYDYLQRSYLPRPFAWPAMARIVSTVAHVDAGQVNLGPLPGVLEIDQDQRLDPTLDTARFIAGITFRGLAGAYVCNPNLMAPAGSDYSLAQYGRVMDKICRTTRAYFLQALSSSVRLNPSTGFILEKDAQSLEQGNDAALRATVIADGDVSSVRTSVSRVDNISATKTITVTVQAVPLGYLKTINVSLTFVNPANA